MSNEELIAEARESQSDPMLAVYLEAQKWGYELSTTEAAHIAEAALEAQSAPLVADSREALARGLYIGDFWGEDNPGRDWDELIAHPIHFERYRDRADRLLASGVVSLAADRDRAKWQEGHRYGLLDARQGVTTVNPYRESEARND